MRDWKALGYQLVIAYEFTERWNNRLMANITPKISVLSPSIRPAGLKYTQESLQKQTFKDFEWLVELGLPGQGHDLNAAYNRMLRRARGELIVSLQDYITIPEDGLEQFWTEYQKDKETLFTAPVGKTLDGENITWDWRTFAPEEMSWQRWEIDWGAAPLEVLKKIGGFDEELDQFWSSDNLSVGLRANMFGYKFKNLPDNQAVAFNHDAQFPHPFRENFNPEFTNQRLESYKFNPKLTYL